MINITPKITNKNQNVPNSIPNITSSPKGEGIGGTPGPPPTANISKRKISPTYRRNPKAKKPIPILVMVFKELPLKNNFDCLDI
jgi:hypothetical protein